MCCRASLVGASSSNTYGWGLVSRSWCTLLCFFFFQAEDGIRDRTVTGVQTCALPIWSFLLDRLVEDATRAGWHTVARVEAGPETAEQVVGRGLRPKNATLSIREPTTESEIGRASCRERGENREGGRARQTKIY